MLQQAYDARSQIEDLVALAQRDLATIWAATDTTSADAAKPTLMTFYPQLVAEYNLAATSLACDLYDQWRDERPLLTAYSATPLGDLALDALEANVRYALGSVYRADPSWDDAYTLLSGSLDRHVGNAHRDTIELNAQDDPADARYARHASANACKFCRMLATRGAVYLSAASAGGVVGRGPEKRRSHRNVQFKTRYAASHRTRGERKLGEEYHDHCHCSVIAVWPGDTYQEAPYVTKWREDGF